MRFSKILNWSKRYFLEAASGLYASLGWIRVGFYRRGLLRSRRLSVPVICVGDLVLGGSGKTPTVIALAEHFQKQGFRVAVLCSAEAGPDEAVMISQRIPEAAVLSGKNRYALGKSAVGKFKSNLIILDGGYQHLGLARDVNILMVTPDLFSPKSRGSQILREPLSGMRRADLCLLTKTEHPQEEAAIKNKIRGVAPGLPILQARLLPHRWVDKNGTELPLDFLKGKRVLAFSGLAEDRGFYRQLAQTGVELRDRQSFPDHFAYSPRIFDKICQRARRVAAEILVTTEKDSVKFQALHILHEIPLFFLRVQMNLPFPEKTLDDFLIWRQKIPSDPAANSPEHVKVLAPNLNRRFSGVTASILSTIPALEKYYPTRVLGNGLPGYIPSLSWREFLKHYRRGPIHIWHARRNLEMLGGLILKKILGFPLILLWTSAAQRRHKGFTRFLYQKMDGIIASTDAAAGYLHRPSSIIPHGIDTQRFHPVQGRKELWKKMRGVGEYGIGIFGRVRPNKGTGDFVEVLIELLPSFPQWSGVIIGETTPKFRRFQKGLQEKIIGAGLQDRLVFLGKLEDFAKVIRWYQALTLVVSPPWIEGYGLTVPEAMACGCGVIATRTGAFPQIIESGKNGWLIPCRDRVALRDTLEQAIKSPARFQEIGIAAKKHIEAHFSIEQEAAQLAKVYRDLFTKVSPEDPA